MGWDVMILNYKYDSSIKEIDHETLPAFGSRKDVVEKIMKFFPGVEWEDLQYGHLANTEYFGNIDLGDDEPMAGLFWLGIYGGSNPLNLINTLCNEYGWSAFDIATSEYLNIEFPDDKGWKHFLAFREKIRKYLDGR